MNKMEIYEQFVKELCISPPKNREELGKRKKKVCALFGMPLARNSELIESYRRLILENKIIPSLVLEKILKKRTTRTMSGVATVSVISKPYPCPGRCIFCPTEYRVPKSYLSNEPSVMKAIAVKYDPYKQVKIRLKTYQNNGHDSDKIELIVQGGTWSYFKPQYKFSFIKRCFDACNDGATTTNPPSKNLQQAQTKNETAKHRVVGLTLETRPDYITEKEIIQMRRLGCTRVEIGVQNIYDDVLLLNKRLHKIDAVINATNLLKRAGFKISYHMMPNLPGSDLERDYAMFVELFNNPNFQPDMLKIYPCSVLKNAPLYQWYKDGRFVSYTDQELFDLLFKIKKILPEYVRVNRLIRDIPTTIIESGNKFSNLRQMLQSKMKEDNLYCKCIRCREVRHFNNELMENKQPILDIYSYQASDGVEYFLSYISPDRKILYAFLRLRVNNEEKNFIKELNGVALIREIHTYGQLAPINSNNSSYIQHLGFGKLLLSEAERIIKGKTNLKKIAVIAGVGVREYYKKQGYELEGTYMTKNIK